MRTRAHGSPRSPKPHHAHVTCVALLCGGSDRATLHEADAIYSDPAELTIALGSVPFGW
jgi:hypothetical protein